VAWPPEGGSKCRANLIPPEEAEVGKSLHRGPCHVHCRVATSGPDLGRELRAGSPQYYGQYVHIR